MSALIPAWENGTLKPLDKIEVHRRGLRHPAVSVFLLRDGATLLQRRAMGKYHTPGLWTNACCTHPHWGEVPAACATRRLAEELGTTAPPLTHRGLIEYRADVGGGLVEHEVVNLFTAELPETAPLDPNPAEVMDLRWIEWSELDREIAARPELFTPWLRLYLADHADRILPQTA